MIDEGKGERGSVKVKSFGCQKNGSSLVFYHGFLRLFTRLLDMEMKSSGNLSKGITVVVKWRDRRKLLIRPCKFLSSHWVCKECLGDTKRGNE